ncbi:MAG TPA: glucosaminidase domain-containing protein [Ruminiclostridium sp.]|nr:glucosaminidase domain-containing protein [Ruminiclostridium sp.]
MKKKRFIRKVAPLAQKAMEISGIPASLAIAQAADSSRWGKRVHGNNLYHTRAYGWNGRTLIVKSKGIDSGKKTAFRDLYRCYDNWSDSIDDYEEFLTKNPRYRNLFDAKNYRELCRNVQEDGYSNDQGYANRLIKIIEKYGLARYDKVP